jgi:general secretion pathway protein G
MGTESVSTRNSTKRLGAFTLVELLIVIIVIAILAAIAIPKFINSGQRSKEGALHADLKLARNAVQLFSNDTGAYPATLSALAATTAPAAGIDSSGNAKAITASDYKGPYLSVVNNDDVSGSPLTYSTTSGSVGTISSSASGNDSSGVAFSSY